MSRRHRELILSTAVEPPVGAGKGMFTEELLWLVGLELVTTEGSA
jgi:hypothetical protein